MRSTRQTTIQNVVVLCVFELNRFFMIDLRFVSNRYLSSRM